jgi:RNA polymerase sigma-70 factor (ECF subfamily)
MTPRFPDRDCPADRDLPAAGEWPARYGDALYRYALDRLRRTHEAEEAVQDTLLAALKARAQFAGRSHPRTWLMGILKRKVADRLRAAARRAPETDPKDLDVLFNAGGKWRTWPGRWADPAAAAERSEFWVVVRRCLANLPSRMAGAFVLRTLDGQEPSEVCRELALAPGHLWVLLHRARLRLVRCLHLHWFAAEE